MDTADAPDRHLKLQDTASQMLALLRHPPDDDGLDVPCQQATKRRRVTFNAGCGKRRQRPPGAAKPCTPGPQASCQMESKTALAAGVTNTPLAALVGGPYFTVTSWLESTDLCHMDAACRLLHAQNSLPSGPWFVNGDRTFFGMELDVGTGFLAFDHEKTQLGDFSASSGSSSWKARCKLFHIEAPSFSPPFSGPEIMSVEHPDEVAYCRCRIRADLLARRPDRGIYVEIEVLANADNLSLAVVDFEGGGRSSVTFSPETGAVLRERKVRESPRAIEGTYIHLLPAAPPGRKFEGSIGLYLAGGHLAFFRRWSGGGAPLIEGVASNSNTTSPGAWESTGFCTDLKWAQGSRLSMCLAFRDDGAYHVRVAKVSISPPLLPKASKEAYQEDTWSLLYGDDDHPLAI